ncbi:MAG: right-handed parallel beta-helix repeat-containing protein [Candidatus Thiodiazotropha sp. (ex Notomyrtea botanica)]|nr:right-handed parallel beta-helix repeat-containing protein [Candidatus Thiodiazotropha sp. (ex Notomyrtea botanica)]
MNGTDRKGASSLIWVVLSLLAGCASQSLQDVELPPPPQLASPSSDSELHQPRQIFVDVKLSRETCKDYDPHARMCGEGTHTAYRDLNHASSNVRPGDRVQVRAGVIREQFVPAVSGTEGRPISFQPYAGERVIFSGIQQPAWLLLDRYYLIIEGFRVEKVLGWGRLENAHYNEIRNNHFEAAQARGTTGGLKLTGSHYNRIEGNRFLRGNDSLVIQVSDRNLVADNYFEWGRHSLLSLRCGNYNVIRGNTFHNERQKAMEIYDCEGVSDAPYRLDATKRNLIERNRFIHARASSRSYKYNAIQYAGQYGIVRHNLFRDNLGGALNIAVYSDEALHNYGHRIYNNTFYANRCFGLINNSKGGARTGEHVMLNNLFYKNRDCQGGPHQVDMLWGGFDTKENALTEADPGFVSETGGDLRLNPDSAWIDKGRFLTRTLTKGRGRTLPLEDVAFFFDGAGVPTVSGDLIQLEGGSQSARVVKVDFSTSSLLLDETLTWHKGQGVSLTIGGSSPDMGAYEAEAE